MTAPFLSPGFRATDSDDNPLAGGYINFYAAGTTTPKEVFSDADLATSLGTTVNLNSAGAPVSGANTPVLIYPGLGDYKIRYYDADDTLIFEFDDYPGAAEEVVESTSGLPIIPVDSKTSAYTVTADDRANLLNCNPTGGSFAITLPSAVTMGDNFLVGIRHNGTANAVTIVATGSQVIRFQGNRAAFSLVGQGETIWLASDGSDWIANGYVPPFRKSTDPYFIVIDRITAPPADPDAGARYLINGTPTGAWNTLGFADKDIAEADGNGSWIKHTPAEGWLAFDADEKVSLVFKEGVWENFQVDPGTSTLKTIVVQDQKSSGTVGGTATTDAWTTAVLNTSVENTITDASLAANKITLPGGFEGAAKRYRVRAQKAFYTTETSQIRFKTDADDSIILRGEVVRFGEDNDAINNNFNSRTGGVATLLGEFEITESTDFILQYYVNRNQGTNSLGVPASISSTNEVYATVLIEDLSSQQGPKGDQGDPGEGGLDAAYAYQFNTATSGDPGTGKILVNNATPASVTQIAVNQTDANGALLTTVIASWDDSTSTTSKARIRFQKEGSPQNFQEYRITAAGTDAGDYWTFPVSYVGSGGTIDNNNDIAVLVVDNGDIGDPGTTVPDISGLTALAIGDLDPAADELIVYDATSSSHKRLPARLFNAAAVVITVGAGGDHATINAALAAASRLGRNVYVAAGLSVEISLLTGFVMAEQVILDRIDLSYCTITSVDAEVTITRSALTTLVAAGTDSDYPAFSALNGAKLPQINVLFNMDTSGTADGRTFMYLETQSWGFIGSGYGCKNPGGRGVEARYQCTAMCQGAVLTDCGNRALYALYGSNIHAEGCDVSGSGSPSPSEDVAVYALYGSTINFRAGDASGCACTAIMANQTSHIDAELAICDDNTGTRAMYSQRGSLINFFQGSMQNCTGEGMRTFAGSGIVAREVDFTGTSDTHVQLDASWIDFGFNTAGPSHASEAMYHRLIGGRSTSTLMDIMQTTATAVSGGVRVLVGDNGATEAIRWDYEGRGIVGHTAALSVAGLNAYLQIHGGANTGMAIGRFSADATGPQFNFLKSRNATPGASTILNDGDDLGYIIFAADDGTDYVSRAAQIMAEIDGTPGANDTPGRLVFGTAADGANTITERMRITSAGNVKIGGSAARGTTEGTNQLALFNGTAPAGTLANGVSFYSASGEARVMDAAGNSTLLSPHDQETNEWIYHSVDTRTGKGLRIDMERMMRAINDKFGWDFVKEFEVK